MSEPIFIDIKNCKGVESTKIELVQVASINVVNVHSSLPICYLYCSSYAEHIGITFIDIESRDDFVNNLKRIISRKATLVTI